MYHSKRIPKPYEGENNFFRNEEIVTEENGFKVSRFVTTDKPYPIKDDLVSSQMSLENQLKAGIPLSKVTLQADNRLMFMDKCIGMLQGFESSIKTIKSSSSSSVTAPSSSSSVTAPSSSDPSVSPSVDPKKD